VSDVTNAYLNNDGTLRVTGLVGTNSNGDEVDLDGATISYIIYDIEEVAVPSASGNLSQIGTSNDYIAEVDEDTINLLTEGEEYTIRVTGSDGGYDFEFDIPIRCTRRRV
jgi:hypothetical protein